MIFFARDGRAAGTKTVESEIFGTLLIPVESLTNGISKVPLISVDS